MKTRPLVLSIACAAVAGAMILLATGCSVEPSATSGSDQPVLLSASGTGSTAKPAAPSKGRAELWAQTCNRCHNYRPAGSYSDAQWETVMLHMRVRVPLTAEEHKAILEFLQASN